MFVLSMLVGALCIGAPLGFITLITVNLYQRGKYGTDD